MEWRSPSGAFGTQVPYDRDETCPMQALAHEDFLDEGHGGRSMIVPIAKSSTIWLLEA